jgi:tRNA1Val (adenine37-N6)-methyltransferase
MANDWFQFKQFMIRQDRTPMKVGTDGVLLGAWAGSGWLLNILDVGTGTGLIALMMAQRFTGAHVDAVELDPESASQAAENVAGSPFARRVAVHQADFLTWDPGKKYDLIVCNPPFFKDSLQSPDPGRTVARHEDSMPLADLIRRCNDLLVPGGGLSLILPVGRLPEVAKLAVETGLNLNRILRVRGNPKVAVRRVLIHLDKQYLEVEMGELTLETETRGLITDEYAALIGGFLQEK